MTSIESIWIGNAFGFEIVKSSALVAPGRRTVTAFPTIAKGADGSPIIVVVLCTGTVVAPRDVLVAVVVGPKGVVVGPKGVVVGPAGFLIEVEVPDVGAGTVVVVRTGLVSGAALVVDVGPVARDVVNGLGIVAPRIDVVEP